MTPKNFDKTLERLGMAPPKPKPKPKTASASRGALFVPKYSGYRRTRASNVTTCALSECVHLSDTAKLRMQENAARQNEALHYRETWAWATARSILRAERVA